MPVILERSEGKKVVVGDHTLVTVLSIQPDGNGVRLGFDSVDQVNRVDNPKMMRIASEVEAAASSTAGRRSGAMLHPPIYLTFDDGDRCVSATLSQEAMDSFSGDMEVKTITHARDMGVNYPSLLLIRVTVKRDSEVLKAVVGTMSPRLRLRSTAELEDGMIYMLFNRLNDGACLQRLDLATVHGR